MIVFLYWSEIEKEKAFRKDRLLFLPPIFKIDWGSNMTLDVHINDRTLISQRQKIVEVHEFMIKVITLSHLGTAFQFILTMYQREQIKDV
jgi:hypothetical protein